MQKPRLLIIAFSNISADSRVLRQVQHFRDRFQVTTCGYGPKPAGAADHIRIPDSKVYWKYPRPLVLAHLYPLAYFTAPVPLYLRPLLRSRTFDAVLANDIDPLPLAAEIPAPLGRQADLHEYFPASRTPSFKFRQFVRPFRMWLLRTYLPQFDYRTTVAPIIAKKYEDDTDQAFGVVVNAGPYHDLEPTPAGRPLRLVHTGGAMADRGLEQICEGVLAAKTDVTLDLFLLPNDRAVLRDIMKIAASSKGKVRVHPPVPQEDLVKHINQFDVSVMFIQPTHFSYQNALPNKLFEAVQARLGVLTGPSPEISQVVSQYQIGQVAPGFTAQDVARAVDSLTPEKVDVWKQNSGVAAQTLSFERQKEGWRL